MKRNRILKVIILFAIVVLANMKVKVSYQEDNHFSTLDEESVEAPKWNNHFDCFESVRRTDEIIVTTPCSQTTTTTSTTSSNIDLTLPSKDVSIKISISSGGITQTSIHTTTTILNGNTKTCINDGNE